MSGITSDSSAVSLFCVYSVFFPLSVWLLGNALATHMSANTVFVHEHGVLFHPKPLIPEQPAGTVCVLLKRNGVISLVGIPCCGISRGSKRGVAPGGGARS